MKNNIVKIFLISATILLVITFFVLIFFPSKLDELIDISKPSAYFPKQKLTINLELAENKTEKIIGLMHHRFIAENSGMLFIYSDQDQRSFWMKNMNFSIDILFIDKNLKICDWKLGFKPCPKDSCPNYVSKCKAQYVLEVNSGFVKKNHLKLEDNIVLEN